MPKACPYDFLGDSISALLICRGGRAMRFLGGNYDVPMRFNMPEACPYDLGGPSRIWRGWCGGVGHAAEVWSLKREYACGDEMID